MQVNPENLEIRLLEPSDSVSELTLLLNRAYKRLADMGLKYVATWQDDEITRKRLKGVECYVGLINGKIIAMVSLRPPSLGKGCEWYKRTDVATFNQFGVEPELQGNGIGSVMLEFIENRARELGAVELAFDTAEHAKHLIEWYGKMGYRFVQNVDWEMTNYISVVMSKALSLHDGDRHSNLPGTGQDD